MTYRNCLSLVVLAAIAGSALAQNDPALPGDGYPVARNSNPITIDGKITNAAEWSEAAKWGWGANDPGGLDKFLPGIRYGDGSEETVYTWTYAMLWDGTKDTGGLYVWGTSDNTDAPYINSSGGVAFDNGHDSANFYFDPNRDGENTIAPATGIDGYQFGFNVASTDGGAAPPVQQIEDSVDLGGDLGIYWEAHVNGLWGNQGASKYVGNGAGPLTALQANNVNFQLAMTGDPSTGWSFEAFVPWSMFDGCSGGAADDGDGLCVASEGNGGTSGETGPGTVQVGDVWYYDLAYYTAPAGPISSVAASGGGATGGGFANWPDLAMVFAETKNPGPNCDLNGDGRVDAADAGIMFGDWGGPGSTSVADKNGDGFVDAADAGVMFAQWTGDLAPAGSESASAEYNAASGELRVNVNGAVNVFVNSAGGLITPLAASPPGVQGLLTNNKNRVGMTNLSPINVSDFNFGSIGANIPMADLSLVYSPRLGGQQVTVPFSAAAGAQAHYIPEPASFGLIAVGLAGLLGARRRS